MSLVSACSPELRDTRDPPPDLIPNLHPAVLLLRAEALGGGVHQRRYGLERVLAVEVVELHRGGGVVRREVPGGAAVSHTKVDEMRIRGRSGCSRFILSTAYRSDVRPARARSDSESHSHPASPACRPPRDTPLISARTISS